MDFREALKSSTIDIFTTMLNMQVAFDSFHDKTPNGLKFDVTGIIGLAGKCQGSVAIHLSKLMAMKITSAMLTTEIKELTPEVEDCIGEMANMITGGAKTVLASHNIDFDLSLPTVVVGENHSTNQMAGDGTSGVLVFKTDDGQVVVEFMVKGSGK